MKIPNRFGGLFAWVGVVALGCEKPPLVAASSSQAAAAPAPAAGVQTYGAACALSGGKASQAAPRVFIELAVLQGKLKAIVNGAPAAGAGAASTGVEQILSDPRVERFSVHHVLAPNDAPQVLPWDIEQRDGSTERWDITVTPHVDAPPAAGVRMALTLASSRSSSPTGGVDPGRAHTTLVVHDQQSVVIGDLGLSQPEGKEVMLIVTPYVIWEQADLGRLYECKRKRAQKARTDGR